MEIGNQSGGLYYLDPYISGSKSCVSKNVYCVSKFTWHSRLGHPTDQALNILKNKLNFSNVSLPPCEVCRKSKQTREAFHNSLQVTKFLGELVHLDVWGPYRFECVGGFRFFLTIVDDFTRATWVFLLKSKEEVFQSYVVFLVC